MSEKELEVKSRLLKLREEEKNDYLVVYSKSEMFEKTYGDTRLQGCQYELFNESLRSLCTKVRKFFVKDDKGPYELSIVPLRYVGFEDLLTAEGFLAIEIVPELVKLNKLYTSFPSDHFALLRKTPPKTVVDKTEIRFFDFLRNEAPHNGKSKPPFRRIKNSFLELIGGKTFEESRNLGKLADRIEQFYLPKATHPDMALFEKWHIDINSDGSEVYVFHYRKSEVD